tara:strand:- start:391 stop:1119 length:729 start_codon:yes stop_codon:yes gene_type:complete
VFRFKDKALAEQAARIMKSWSLSSTQLDLKTYLERYPKREWPDRHQKDITNFFTPDNNAVTAPATPYLESKANADFRDLHNDANKALLSREGVRRAIKFSARRELTEQGISKGQRCSPAAVAAFQAALLAEIVKIASKNESKKIKVQSFDEYSKTLLKPGWEKSDIGQRLMRAMESNDFGHLFPDTLNVDQRYATPQALIEALTKDKQFEYVGQFSIFNNRAEVVDHSEKVFEHSATKVTPR